MMYEVAMTDGWFRRLLEAIDADGKSKRQLSLDAGLGPNFVSQMITSGKEPGIQKVQAILSCIGESTAVYVMTGIKIDSDGLEMLRGYTSLSPADQKNFKSLLRSLAGSGDAPTQSDGPQD